MSRRPSNAPSQKAQYRPSAAGTRSLFSMQSQNTAPAAYRGGLGTAGTLFSASTAIDRNRFHMPQDRHLRKAIHDMDKYLEETEVEKSWDELLAAILTGADLPYNPYPLFVRQMRIKSERYHMYRKTDEDVLKFITYQTERSHIHHIVRAKKCDYIWGLKNIVQYVNPEEIGKYVHLVQDVVPKASALEQVDGYSNQVMASLVGPCVFTGTLYQESYSIDIRLEFLITGSDLKKGLKMFVTSILKDLDEIDKTKHKLLGITVPMKLDPDDDEKWKMQYWPKDVANQYKDRFWQTMTEAVTENKLIYAECLFCVDSSLNQYKRGQKQYGLHFVEVASSREDEEELHYFTEFPLMTLYEGVFLKQTHAEAYVSIFMSRIKLVDKDNQETQGTNSQDEKVATDGFIIPGKAEFSPEAWQIAAPIKSSYQKKVANMDGQLEIYEKIYYVLLLILMDRDDYEDVVLIELYRLLQSTGARMYSLLRLNKTLRELVLKYEGNLQYNPVVIQLFSVFKEGLESLLENDLFEMSSNLVVNSQVITSRLRQIISLQDSLVPMVQLNRKTLESMKNLHTYTDAVLVQLADDAIVACEQLVGFISKLRKVFPEEVKRPQTQARDRTKGRTGVKAGEGGEILSHGIEDNTLKKHDSQVINVEMCMETDDAPKMVATESVLLKYILDTHLDEVWTNYVVELVSGSYVPPNPYPRLITSVRIATMKMDLCYETKEKICERLVHNAARVEDAKNQVWTIPGCDVHGLESSLQLLDSGTWFQLSKLIAPLINTNFIKRRGFYKTILPQFVIFDEQDKFIVFQNVAICCAVVGDTMYHGRMDPYIRELVLNEHCYIRGPDGCSGEALQLYSKIVFDHISNLYKEKGYPIAGIYMGKDKTRWSISEFLNKKKAFAYEFERHLTSKEPVVLRFFVQQDWRYIAVEKHFLLHFMNDTETDFILFYEDNPADMYRNVFLDGEKASFHSQYCGTRSRNEPYSPSSLAEATHALDTEILVAKETLDWLNVYRGLLLRNTIAKGTAMVSESWRLFHSIGGQVEYAVYLGRALQDLLRFVLEKEELREAGQLPRNEQEEDVNDVRVDPVEAVMSQMVIGFRQKVESILQSPRALTSRVMLKMILSRLKQVTERDDITKELFLIIKLNTQLILEEICQILQSVQDVLTYDVHCINTEAQALLQSVEVEYGNERPSSVDSMRLDQDDGYRSRPRAIVMDRVDSWVEH